MFLHQPINVVKRLVKAILTSPHDLKWSTQGLGMLRTYLSPELRLHVWHPAFAVPNASPLHDHPWHLDSVIVAGILQQHRYMEAREYSTSYAGRLDRKLHASPFKFSTIKCGKDACTLSEPEGIQLVQLDMETFHEGDCYRQRKDEIHESLPQPGTVTLVQRTFDGDTEHARVFWREGNFVSAEPAPASRDEINFGTQYALHRWFLDLS